MLCGHGRNRAARCREATRSSHCDERRRPPGCAHGRHGHVVRHAMHRRTARRQAAIRGGTTVYAYLLSAGHGRQGRLNSENRRKCQSNGLEDRFHDRTEVWLCEDALSVTLITTQRVMVYRPLHNRATNPCQRAQPLCAGPTLVLSATVLTATSPSAALAHALPRSARRAQAPTASARLPPPVAAAARSASATRAAPG